MSTTPLDDLTFILPQQHLRQAVAQQEELLLWSAERHPKALPYGLLLFVGDLIGLQFDCPISRGLYHGHGLLGIPTNLQ